MFFKIPKKIFVTLLLLAAVFITGTLGYVIIEGWKPFDALYMTVITLATVGYGETNPLSNHGRLFTIFLIMGGIGILTYAFTSIMSFIIEGELTGIMRRRKMEKEIQNLRNHYIICADSETGEYAIEEFLKTKQQVVVISSSKTLTEKLQENMLTIFGNPGDDKVLQSAGIEHARGLVSILNEDKDNLFVVLSAKGLNPGLKIVTQAIERESANKLKKAGADEVVSTNLIGGMRIASVTLRPAVVSFLDTMLYQTVNGEPLRVEEGIITESSHLKGKPLSECKISEKTGLIVIAIKEKLSGKFVYNPSQSHKVLPGDAIIVIGTPSQAKQLHTLIETV
ncbi:MAG: hypothetical protein A2252_08785 [Elusimicrobia bacterium RIFOXYA2_FULL_39_19]|nr:MAG: hypothetical protein A2252_08785 [Elusimicrobia bacterium RIFOXYA2_FULL_39_19]